MKFFINSAVALFMAAVVALGVVITTPQVAVAQDNTTTAACKQDLGIASVNEADRGKTPVLFVHGYGGKPGVWLEGMPSMKATLDLVEGAVVTNPFDYQSESTKWVAGSNAAHRLAKTIVCYYLLYEAKVVAVDHSMGGLLTYEASSWAAYGVNVSDALGHIATIGSPFEGSWLASGVFETAIAFCKLVGIIQIGQLVMEELCREANSDWSTSGLSYDSAQLEALPDLPEGITHKAIAGRIQMEVCFFGCVPFSVGDGVVPSESATARYTDTGVGDGITIFDCTISEGAWCEHSNMLQAEQVQQEVKASIEAYIASQQVEMTNLHGLELPLGDAWELSYMTLHAPSERPYSTVVNTELCEESEANDYCAAGFTVVDVAAYNQDSSWRYGEGGECPWYSLRDGQWHTPPKTVEELTIGGRPATHRTHWQCDSDGNGNATPPQSAEAAQDIMHSWEIGDIVVVDQDFESDEPLAGLEDLLAGASVS